MTAHGISIVRQSEHHRDGWARWRVLVLGPSKSDIVAEESFTGTRDQAWRAAENLGRKYGYMYRWNAPPNDIHEGRAIVEETVHTL